MSTTVYILYYQWNTQRPGCGEDLATVRRGIFSTEVKAKAVIKKEKKQRIYRSGKYFIEEVILDEETVSYEITPRRRRTEDD